MLWPDEIRAADFDNLGSTDDLRPQEVAMASSLVDSMTGDYEPEEFGDDYREAVEKLVEAKLAGGDARDVPVPAHQAAPGGGQVVDLMAALQRSVDAARAGRGGGAAETTEAKAEERAEESAEQQAPARKTAAKRTSGRASTAKKTTAKKAAPAKRPAATKTSAAESTTAKTTTKATKTSAAKSTKSTTKKAASRRSA
jgi:DNA end-binding protein Ku